MKTILGMALLAMVVLAPSRSTAQLPRSLGLLEGDVGRGESVTVHRRDENLSAPQADGEAAIARAPARANPLWDIPLDSLSATRERPLFSETRRPPVVAVAEPVRAVAPPPQEPPPTAPEPPPLKLVGTIAGRDQGVAVFMNSSARQVVRLRIGETDSGWTLRSVGPKTTTLEKDSREVVVSMPPPGTASASEATQGYDVFNPPVAPSGSSLPQRGAPAPAYGAQVQNQIPAPSIPFSPGERLGNEF